MKKIGFMVLGAVLFMGVGRVRAVDLLAWPEGEKEVGQNLLPGHSSGRRTALWPQPRPVLPPTMISLSLTDMRLSGKILNNTVQMTADFRFYNPSGNRMEGVLMVPLPPDVVMTGFVMNSGGKEMKGELLDAQQALSIYENIVRQMRDPGLLELVGQRLLRARVFPIEPRGKIDVTVTYSQLLSRSGELYELTLPFTQGTGNARMVAATVSLDLESTTPLRHLYSPVSGVEIHRQGEKRARLTYQGNAGGPFQVFYGTQEDPLSAGLLAHRDGEEDGFLMLSLSPRPVGGLSSVAKDIVFVVDRSGSMNQNGKMEQAKGALEFCLKSLGPDDRFGLVTLATSVDVFREQLVSVADGKEKALGFVRRIEAAGGTNIEEGLREALQLFKKGTGRVPMVFFITDGLPTIGETDFDRLLGKVRGWADNSHARLYVFGVGDDVNTLLLDRLAQENHGARDYVMPGETIENKVSTLYKKVAKPALTDVHVDWGDADVSDVYPRKIDDLFYGEDLVILGRYAKGEKVSLTVSGQRGDQKEEYIFKLALPDQASEKSFIARLWAHRKVFAELDGIRLGGKADPEVIEGIVRIAKRYGIVTPYTSYLITEDGVSMANAVGRAAPSFRQMAEDVRMSGAWGTPQKARVVQNQSIAFDRAGRVMAPTAGGGVATLGADATEKETKDKLMASGVAVAETRAIESKMFYKRGDTWTDGAYEANPQGPVRDVVALGEDYFKLIQSEPILAKFFSLGKNVIVQWKGVVYKVHPQGE
ncbi:MAG: VWA domain-containing protein [Elusimicrobia bacterium]|nr:VWA domain-containing protein [Elusimicrobiota bacterium]